MNKRLRIIYIFVLCSFIAFNMSGCSKKRSKNTNPVATDINQSKEDSSKKFAQWDKDAQIRAAIENKEYKKAESIAQERVTNSPKDAKAYYFLGKTYLAQDMFTQSKDALETACNLEPENRNYKREMSKCLSAMAELAMQKNMPMEAVIFLKQVIKNNYKTNLSKQKLARAYIKIGNKLILNNNLDEAETLFNQALNVIPDAPDIRVALAKLLIKSDRLMEANRLLDSLLETNPKYIEGMILYAQLLYKMGELDEAKNVVANALNISPDNNEATELQARLLGNENTIKQTIIEPSAPIIDLTPEEAKEQILALEKTENYYEAITLIRGFLANSPTEHWAKLKLANSYLRLGKNAEALETISQYIEKTPDDTEAQFLKAICMKQTNNLEEAFKILIDLVDKNPNRLDISNVLGEVYAKSGKFDKAMEMWNQILLKDNSFAETLFNIAQLNTEMGKYNIAQEYFEKAIHKEPFNAKFIYFAGINLMHSGLKSEAISLWETGRDYLNADNQYGKRILKALGERSNETNSLKVIPPTLATENTNLSNPDMLGSVPDSEISETPESPDYARALDYARGGFFPEAIAGFKAVLAQDPNHFNSLMNLGKVYTASNNHENACAYYLKAVKLAPKNIFALRGLANEYSELGLHKLASEVTKQVKQRAPDQLQGFPRYKVEAEYIRNNPRAFAPLTGAFMAVGLKQEALAVVKTGLTELPDDADLHMLHGDVLRDLGDFNNALASYKIALAKDQQSPAPSLRIGDLYATSSQMTSAIAEYKNALKASYIDADTMLEIVDRFQRLGQQREANRVLGRLKAMNLNQAQIEKLEQHLGTKIEVTPQGEI